MMSCIDCSRMPRACSGVQESNKNTLLSRLSEAWIGSVETQETRIACQEDSSTLRLSVFGVSCVWMRVCTCCAHTWWAGVEIQPRLCRLQQSLYETTGEKRGGENDRSLRVNLDWLHQTVRDEVVFMTWGGRYTHKCTNKQKTNIFIL